MLFLFSGSRFRFSAGKRERIFTLSDAKIFSQVFTTYCKCELFGEAVVTYRSTSLPLSDKSGRRIVYECIHDSCVLLGSDWWDRHDRFLAFPCQFFQERIAHFSGPLWASSMGVFPHLGPWQINCLGCQ